MELEPSRTPDSYKTIQCIEDLGQGIKVTKNTTSAGETFFHISSVPKSEEVSTPSDIQTVRAFQVYPDESERQVEEDVLEEAKRVKRIL